MRKDPFHGVITSFLTLGTLLRAKFDEVAGDFKASAPQVILVSHVLAAKDGLTMAQIAVRMKISELAARVKTDELVVNGILRATGTDDAAVIRVTPHGRIWHRDVNMAYQSRLRQVFAVLPPAERLKVQQAFDKVIASMVSGK